MQLHQLPAIVAKRKFVGRGHAKRGGKSGRGQKGQKSRAGYTRKAGFEGGQTPLYMRLPKGRGMKQKFPSQVVKPLAVTVAQLGVFPAGSIVGPGQLRKVGWLKRRHQTVKLIGNQALKHKLTVRVHQVTSAAQKAVEKAGGKVEILS